MAASGLKQRSFFVTHKILCWRVAILVIIWTAWEGAAASGTSVRRDCAIFDQSVRGAGHAATAGFIL
jgi:hypothetical protein